MQLYNGDMNIIMNLLRNLSVKALDWLGTGCH